MSNVPADLCYTAEHEWVKVVDSTTIRFGITDFAQEALGDIVFVSLPALGADLGAGVSCGEVESTKSVSDIYAPAAGRVSAINSVAETAPDTLNSDPYGNGWIAEVTVEDSAALCASLLTADAYTALTSQ